MSQYTKDPDAVLDFAVDWSEWIEGQDTIVTSVWESPDGLTTADPDLDGAKATIWLSGGVANMTYRVVNRVTTSAGRVDDRTLRVRVAER